MPPFAGTPQELESLVQFIKWSSSGRDGNWKGSSDPQVLAQIQQWLDDAGTRPGIQERPGGGLGVEISRRALAPGSYSSAYEPGTSAPRLEVGDGKEAR
jgi:hypothetical protein